MDDAALRHGLDQLNPTGQQQPAGFDRAAALQRAHACQRACEQAFQQPFLLGTAIQDAAFHATVAIPRVLVPAATGVVPALRLSNFENLAVITAEEVLADPVRAQLQAILEQTGYQYVPWAVFGAPFATRERMNGDLFHRLFEYQ